MESTFRRRAIVFHVGDSTKEGCSRGWEPKRDARVSCAVLAPGVSIRELVKPHEYTRSIKPQFFDTNFSTVSLSSFAFKKLKGTRDQLDETGGKKRKKKEKNSIDRRWNNWTMNEREGWLDDGGQTNGGGCDLLRRMNYDRKRGMIWPETGSARSCSVNAIIHWHN